MIIKINTIDSAHGAAAINYDIKKQTAFLNCRNLDVNILTGEPTSPTDVYHQMRLMEACSPHRLDESFFRMELRPPVEECRNWNEEQWRKFDEDCERAIASIDKVLVMNRKTHKKEWKEVRPINFEKAQSLTVLHTDTDPHMHKVVNRHTVDGQALSSHYCQLIGIHAANIIAEQYGWTRADQRENKRKEKIHADAMKVLKNMQHFDIEAFFKGMRQLHWVVEARYDSQGVCRGYKIGDTPPKSNRPVLYAASKLGHGRKLMASQLEKTWRELHTVEQLRPTPIRQPDAKNQDDAYLRLKAIQKQIKGEAIASHTPTTAEMERQKAINNGLSSIRDVRDGRFKRQFSLRDVEDTLPAAVAAKAIDMNGADGWREPGALYKAAQALVDMVEIPAAHVTAMLEGVMDAVVNMALPPATQSIGGGGGGSNDLPKKKDDDWRHWKNHGFTFKQAVGRKR